MSAPDLSLLSQRRFAPLFVVQFLGAFNDNLLKFALLFLANFGLYHAQPDKAEMLATIATGLFILPYFLFSALAGQLADAWDKAKIVRAVKGAEMVIMSLAVTGFWLQSVPLLLSCLFLMGLHSTLFGPVKFSILPQHLQPGEIMGGTGLIEAGTFIAILSGQLLAGVIPPWEAGLVAVALATLGFLASLAVPPAPSLVPGLRIERNIMRSTWHILKAARHGRGVWLSILGISWFFAVGAVLLAELAPLVSGVLKARQEVATFFLLIFSLSVAGGSMLVNRLLGGVVSARFVPLSALMLAGFMIDLWLSANAYVPARGGAGIAEFIRSAGSWRIMADLFGIAFAGGMFIVPLYAILQTHSPRAERSRTIAANNIVNAATTVALVTAVTAMLARGESVPGVIGVMGGATLVVALISCWLLPDPVIKAVARRLLRLCCRVEVRGAEHLPPAGKPAFVVVNHASFLAGLLIAAFLPGKPLLAANWRPARPWWAIPFLPLFDILPVNPAEPVPPSAMEEAQREARTLVTFRNDPAGTMPPVANAMPIIPIRIEDARSTPCSRLRGLPQVQITILPPRHVGVEEEQHVHALP